MDWIRMIQQAIEYMEDNLTEEITYEDVADSMNFSSNYFHRTFSLVAGISPTEYLRRRRLSQAGHDLSKGSAKVIDMAYKYGYETPESFSKAFLRFHGIAPKFAKVEGSVLRTFAPFVIKVSIEGGSGMDYRVEKVGERKFITLTRSFPSDTGDENLISEFWSEVNGNGTVKRMLELRGVDTDYTYGLCGSNGPKDKGMHDYGIGCEIIGDVDIDDASFTTWTLPAETYIVFNCFGKDPQVIADAWEHFFKEFLPNSNYEMLPTTDFERYPEKSDNDLFCELWIPIKEKDC